MYRIFLEHGEAYGNLGDEAMLLTAVDRLRSVLGDVQFVVPRDGGSPLPDIGPCTHVPSPTRVVRRVVRKLARPERMRRFIHDLEYDPVALFTPVWLRRAGGEAEWEVIRDHLASCDGVYFVGAANLNDHARIPCVVAKYAVAEQARRRGIPLVVSSQTVGPLNRRWVKRMVGRMIASAAVVSTRDLGITHPYLKEAGVDPGHVLFSGDEALALRAAAGDVVDAYLQDAGLSADEPFALFHFRGTDYTGPTAAHYDKLAAALDRMEPGARVCFVPMSYWRHSGDDEACARAIRERMRRPEKLTVLGRTKDVRLVRGLFERARWAIGLSYHVQVFALAAACPFAILTSGPYYTAKGRGVHTVVEERMPLLAMERATPADLVSAVEDLTVNRQAHAAHLASVRDRVSGVNDVPVRAMAAALYRAPASSRG